AAEGAAATSNRCQPGRSGRGGRSKRQPKQALNARISQDSSAENIAPDQALDRLRGERRLDCDDVFDCKLAGEVDVYVKLPAEHRLESRRRMNACDTDGAQTKKTRRIRRNDSRRGTRINERRDRDG